MGSSVSRSPRSLSELWGWVIAELDRLKRRRYLDTGDWLIQQDTNGDLVARHTPTGATRVIVARPSEE